MLFNETLCLKAWLVGPGFFLLNTEDKCNMAYSVVLRNIFILLNRHGYLNIELKFCTRFVKRPDLWPDWEVYFKPI